MSDGHYVIDPGSAIGWLFFSFRGGIYDYSAASADIFHLCHADLAIKFCIAECPACCGRCKIYHGGQRIFHVGIPSCKQLFLCGYVKNGSSGVWIGMYVDWVFRSLLFVIRYKRGKWLNKRVV